MIIDCHGHYTTAPKPLQDFRDAQLASLKDGTAPPSADSIRISDDAIRESLENAQLKLQRERGSDLTIFSPRASAMAHHVGTEAISREWTRATNDLIARVCGLYPDNFAGVCALPQSPGAPPANSIPELERCVNELGFVGCNLNPDPSGGHWDSPPLTDRHWYPIYEKMVELDVPAMVHVSASCNPNFHATGAHYMNADTTAFMQFLTSHLFEDFPTLRFIIPHGGGAVPYHWGRYRGIAQDMKLPPLDELLLHNVFFDTCVYHQPGIDLLAKVIPRRQHPLRVRDGRCRARHRPADRPLLRRHEALRRRAAAERCRQGENLQRQCDARLPAPRREAQGGALMSTFAMDPTYRPYHPNPRKPAYVPPHGAVDAHCHVFGPGDRFPYAAERKYTPCDAPKETLFALRDFLGFDRSVIVQASCHGRDNAALVDALRSSDGTAKGVAVVRYDVSEDELKELDDAGVRAVRFNFVKRLVDATPRENYLRVAEKIAPLGWHIVVYFEAPELESLTPFLTSLPGTIVVDHMGRPDVAKGVDDPDFQRFIRLLDDNPNIWTKVSCPERLTVQGPPYDDVVPFQRTLVERFPDRVLWGTDWPHPNMTWIVPDDGELVDLIPRIAPTQRLQQSLLVDNPTRLYWAQER